MKRFWVCLAFVAPAIAADWSAPVVVEHQFKPVVTYQAKVDGAYLVVQAKIEEGWHTFSMDNDLRAEEALEGKPSLGVDGPTKITLASGLESFGEWVQTEPKDFSKPALRWYSWGYEEPAVFATKVSGSGPTTIGIRGQACTETTCKNIDVELTLAADSPAGEPKELDLKSLIHVRRK